jgi:hypothetical protein
MKHEYTTPEVYITEMMELLAMKIEEWNYTDADELLRLVSDFCKIAAMKNVITNSETGTEQLMELYETVGIGPYTPAGIDRSLVTLWGVDELNRAVVGLDEEIVVVDVNDLLQNTNLIYGDEE